MLYPPSKLPAISISDIGFGALGKFCKFEYQKIVTNVVFKDLPYRDLPNKDLPHKPYHAGLGTLDKFCKFKSYRAVITDTIKC